MLSMARIIRWRAAARLTIVPERRVVLGTSHESCTLAIMLTGGAVRITAAPDPALPLDACTLPGELALSLFVPRRAGDPEEALTALADRITSSLVVLAPIEPRSRHDRVALRPRLGEGRAIGLHPAWFTRFAGRPLSLCVPRSAAARARALQLRIHPELLSARDGSFLAAPSREAAFGLWYATLSRAAAAHAGTFPSVAAVDAAFAAGALEVHAPIDVRIAGRLERTTVGRALLRGALAPSVPLELGRPLHAAAARRTLEGIHRASGARAACAAAEALWSFGLRFATQAGLSLAAEDLRFVAYERGAILEEARRERQSAWKDYQAGKVAGWEVEVRAHDAFVEAGGRMRDALPRWLPPAHPLRALRDAGAGVDDAIIVRLSGVLPPMWAPSWEAWTFDRSLSDGLSPHQSFALALEGRAVEVRAQGRAAALRGRLAGALGGVRITRFDCGATEGMTARPVISDLRIVTPLGARVVGRVALADVLSSNGSLLVRAGAVIDERAAAALDRLLPSVAVRSPVACMARDGVCACCHGWERAARRLPAIGAPVGLDAVDMLAALRRAAQARSLGVLAARVYAPRALRPCEALPAPGRARYEGIAFVDLPDEVDEPYPRVMVAEMGRVAVHDDRGEEIAAYVVRKGHRLHCEDGRWLARGAQPVSTYIHGEPQIADIPGGAAGVVSWDATHTRRFDERSGRAWEDIEIHRLRIHGATPDGAAFEQIVDCEGDRVRVMVDEGDTVRRGDLVALDARGRGTTETCGDLDLERLISGSGEPAAHEAWLRRDPAGFVEHLVADLEEAVLGMAPRVGTVWFEMWARVHLATLRARP
jgi:DNA-directed RNA polymerase subunit beta'